MSNGQIDTSGFAIPTPPPPADSEDAADLADPLISMLVDGRYRVRSRMARGGMASVYVAHDERLDRPVALKIMHPHLAESERFTARFRQEARAAARISNPGVVPVFDQGVFQGQGYLVMELIDGPHLREFVATHGPITLGEALDAHQQILSALSAAHRAGVIHRDLKPENVLVAPDGTLKLTDFGLARAVSEITMSSTGTIMGTVAYLAPEVALSGESDGRTDLYAVGIMLFEMITGEVPGSDAENPVQLALSRVNAEIPAPSTIEDWVPTEVDNLVTSLAAREPADRPLSAHDAAQVVSRVKEQIPQEILDHPLRGSAVASAAETGGFARTDAIQFQPQTSLLPASSSVVRTSGTANLSTKKRSGKGGKRALIIISVLLIMVGLALGFWWWWQEYGPGAYQELPDLQNQTVEEAEAALTELSLASVLAYEHSDDIEVDRVVRTNPAAGERVHKDEEITLYVSSGVLMLTVPEVAGETAEQAVILIRGAGLEVGEESEAWSEEFAEGEVISTSPAEGETIDHRTPVDLVVSKGREPIAVPDLLGEWYDEAAASVEALGLQVERLEDYSDDYEIGTVSAVSPEPGTTLHRGGTVSLTYCLGSEYVEVPGVKGLSRPDAINKLEAAGLNVEVQQLAQFFDTVGSQSIGAGQWVKRGTTIQITVV